MHRLAEGLERLLTGISAMILAGLLAVVLTAVTLRYFFATGLTGSEELAIWLYVALVSVGAPLMVGRGLGMRMDVFSRLLPPKGQVMAEIIADGFVIVAALVLIGGGVDIIANLGSTSTALGVPESIRFALPAMGGALTLLVLTLGRLAEGAFIRLIASILIGGAAFSAAQVGVMPSDLPPSAWAGIIAFIGLLVGAPIAHVLLACAYLALPFGASMPEPAIAASAVAGMSKFLLLAIPFFLLAGGIFAASDLAQGLIRFAASLVGHWRGGLAQTTLMTSVLFSGASGSSIANAAFMATSMGPALVKRGYQPAQAGGIIAATAMLDNIIPPSIAFLILAAATSLSVGKLLTGGLMAGLVLAMALGVTIRLTAREAPSGKASSAERWQSGWLAAPAIGLGIVVIAGVRFGLVTTTEASALAALYTILVCLRRPGGRSAIVQGFREAAVTSAAIGLLIGAASPLAFLIAVDDVGSLATQAVQALGSHAAGVMLLANLVLLVAGLFLDTGVAILLLAPILLPVATAAGIDPIQFGVILIVNLMIGSLTPPVGMLVYVVSGVMRLPVGAVFRAVLPFLAALLVALALLCAAALIF
jgi:tripartite ATP-independent transporter DctM subunit